MSDKIKAITAYRPRIVLGQRADLDDLVGYIAGRTGLNESGIRQVLLELRDAVTFFALRGQPVKLEGLGTSTPKIRLDGDLGIGHRVDTQIRNRLNMPRAFRGAIERRENIGKTSDDLVAMWNAEYPDDQIAA